MQDTVFDRHKNLHIRLIPTQANLLQACRNPSSILADPSCKIVKQDHATTVGRITISGVELAIKQYHLRNPGYAIKRSVRHSRAHNCWHMARKLIALGIATPPPVAAIEERMGPFRRRSWFLSQWLEGEICSDYLLPNGLTEATRPACLSVSNLLKLLHQHQIAHGDLKASNILLTPDGPVLLDLDATHSYRLHSPTWHYHQQRDQRRFLRNWQQHPELLDYFSRQLIE